MEPTARVSGFRKTLFGLQNFIFRLASHYSFINIPPRSTNNSRSAGQVPGLPSNIRSQSQEPLVQRRRDRISASQSLAAKKASELIHSIPTNSNNPNSSLSIIPEMTVPSTSGGASGHGAGTSGNIGVVPVRTQISTRKMPKPGEKNAPVFDTEKPEELGRFFERMEDWFTDEDIEDSADRKKRIVRYLDADSESQWKALSSFKDGTYEDFKAEVMASYPKAEEVMKGSVSALRKKIKRLGPIEADDRDELLSLIRIMTAEVLKLKQISPPIHTNRELVELFLGRLSPDFAARVANKLSVHRLLTPQNPADDPPARNTEDMYDVEDVMKMAKHTSLEHANPFGKYLYNNVPLQSAESNVKLEEAVARLEDSINLQIQHSKQVDQHLVSMQSYINQPRPQVAHNGYSRGLAPAQAERAGPLCFYCKGLHRVADCADALRHLDMGWIKRVDGLLRLPDGQNIPRDGGKTMKEVIESLNKPKPGLIPMSKIQDKSSLYQEGRMNTYSQTLQSEDGDLRALTELLQKIGVDRVQQLLSSQDQNIHESEDGWGQNFD